MNADGTAYVYDTDAAYDCVYAFGLDPTWFLSELNILTVQNSVKMKMAVVFGVTHMLMGICVKGLNTFYKKDLLVFFTEVVTGILILGGLFGWMDLLIFAKWFFHYYAYNFELINSNDLMDSDVATEANCV